MPSARAIRAGKAIIELGMPTAEVEKAMKKLAARAKTIGSQFQMVGKMGMAAGGAIAAAFVPTIKAASNLEETMNKFNVVFGDNAKAVKAWSDDFAEQVGRSQRQIADFMGATQDLFVPLGFAADAATEMSKQITALAIDLASFNNMADDAVIRDLHAALTGSGEVMKKYGVLVSEAAVKQELLRQGMDPGAATDQQKVLARLNIILAGTTAAQGDAERSAGSFANQMKALQGKLEDVAAQIGNAILPMVTEFVTKLVDVTKNLGDWVERNEMLIKTVARLGVKLAVAGTAIYAIGTAFNVASVAVRAFSVALALATAHPVIFAITAVATAVGLITLAFNEATAAMDDFSKKAEDSLHDEMIKQAGLGDLAKAQNQPAVPGGPGPVMTPADAARRAAERRAAEEGFAEFGNIKTDKQKFAAFEIMKAKALEVGKALGDGIEDGMKVGVKAIDGAMMAGQKLAEDFANRPLPQAAKFSEAIFDTRFAAQQFGGQKEDTKLLRKIAANTDPKNNAGDGVVGVRG